MSQPRILIVHPDPPSLALLSSMLRSLGHMIDEAANDRVAVRLMERGGIAMVLAGVDPVDDDALELLSYIRRKHRQVPVILLFPTPNPERTQEALRLGALSVLRYPVPATELRAAVTQAMGRDPHRAAPESPDRDGLHQRQCQWRFQPRTPTSTRARPRRPRTRVPRQIHAHDGLRADQFAREMGIIGSDPSLRLAIEMAGTIAQSPPPS